MKRWVLIGIGSVAALAALVWVTGALLPEQHVAASRAAYGQPPDSLFAVITDVAAHPDWRADVDAVDVVAERPLRWRETGPQGSITFRAETFAPPFRFSARIDDPGQPFGGRWIWQIEPDGRGGGVVRITEHGEIYNPLFRFFARFVFGYHSAQESYLRALGTRFDEETTVERLEGADPGPAPSSG